MRHGTGKRRRAARSSAATKAREQGLRRFNFTPVRLGHTTLELRNLGYIEIEWLLCTAREYDDLSPLQQCGINFNMAFADSTPDGVHPEEDSMDESRRINASIAWLASSCFIESAVITPARS